jgi:hypothetical protein
MSSTDKSIRASIKFEQAKQACLNYEEKGKGWILPDMKTLDKIRQIYLNKKESTFKTLLVLVIIGVLVPAIMM